MDKKKECNKCKKDKPVIEFYKIEGYYSSMCKKCKSKLNKELWLKQKKARAAAQLW